MSGLAPRLIKSGLKVKLNHYLMSCSSWQCKCFYDYGRNALQVLLFNTKFE